MPSKKEPLKSRKDNQKPKNLPSIAEEDRSPIIFGMDVETGLSLSQTAQRAQQQEMAASLGRIGGNKVMRQVIQKANPASVQRDNHTDSTFTGQETEPAAEDPTGAAASEAMDSIVQEELEVFLSAFSNISVTVRWGEETEFATMLQEQEIQVHPPYFMNVSEGSSPAARTQERYDAALAHRGAADRAVRNFINEFSRSERRGGWGLGRALVGKSHPEDIQRIVQTALDRGLIPAGAGLSHPDSTDVRNWLQEYGIGVDCSAFVSQALNRAAARVLGRDLESDEILNRGSAQLAGTASGFTPVENPNDLRPGDTMRIPGHIRIITRVRQDETGGVIFTTAESRAGGTLDVGPDRADWRYSGTTLQIRRSETDPWTNVTETPTFGRYDLLEQARSAAAQPEGDEASTPAP